VLEHGELQSTCCELSGYYVNGEDLVEYSKICRAIESPNNHVNQDTADSEDGEACQIPYETCGEFILPAQKLNQMSEIR
jgi:hypothetical protein